MCEKPLDLIAQWFFVSNRCSMPESQNSLSISDFSRFVRERDRKEIDEGKEEMVVTVAISQAFDGLDLVNETLEFSS